MKHKRIKWVEVARRGRGMVPLITEATALGWKLGFFKRFTGGPNLNSYRHFDSARWYDEKELAKVVNYLRTQEKNAPGFLTNLGNKLIKHYFKMKQWVAKNARKSYKDYSNLQLAKAFWDFYSRTFYVPLGYCYIFANRFLPDEIIPELAQKESGLDQQTKDFAILFGLDHLTEIKAEKISLFNLAKFAKNGLATPKAKSLVFRHWQKYKHLKRYYYYGSDYTLKDIKRRAIQARKRLNEAVEMPNLIAKQTRLIIKRLNLSHRTVQKIYGAKALGKASNVFDETFVWNVSRIDPLLIEIAKRLKVKRSELIMCRGEEIVQFLKGGLPEGLRKELREREKDYALVLTDGKIRVYSGRLFERYQKWQLKAQRILETIRTLKGQGASMGRAVGRVKVLLDASEMGKVKKGDILVAPATYPALVPAMERAAAIITNEGGLLSHAAIVSRELGIPCIVGAKIATKVLKDGDLVEADANRGIVKKLS